MKNEDKDVLQCVIDNLQYTDGYKEKLIKFNEKFDPHKKVQYTNKPKEFMFSLDKAI